jgi:hypothetical protein
MLYRKLPVVIQAEQLTKDNQDIIVKFTYGKALAQDNGSLIIPTLEGGMIASIGDYIIQGVSGEFYPCKPDIFMKTYELA